MRLIGINGFKTSGKDTAAEFIKELTPEPVQRVAFADKLKEMAAKALGFEPEDDRYLIPLMNKCKEGWEFRIHAPEWPEVDYWITGREYLQWFGQGAREVFGDTFWIDQVLPADGMLKRRYPGAKLIVVTDVRYPNEAERVLNLGGKVWEVVRPGLESDGHVSEVQLDRSLVTKTIVNDGSLDELRRKVEFAL